MWSLCSITSRGELNKWHISRFALLASQLSFFMIFVTDVLAVRVHGSHGHTHRSLPRLCKLSKNTEPAMLCGQPMIGEPVPRSQAVKLQERRQYADSWIQSAASVVVG
jgi:hypothetical protein